MRKITKEDQATLKEKFPKFSKITACMVNNPEYGVTLSPEAKRWLNRGKNKEKQRNKNVASIRLTYDEMKALSEHGSMTEAIREAIRTVYMNDRQETSL